MKKFLVLLTVVPLLHLGYVLHAEPATAPVAPAATELPRLIEGNLPEYPLFARKMGQETILVIRCELDAEGRVTAAEIEKPDGALFEKRVLAAVKTWRFSPARIDGVAVPATVRIPIHFEMAKSVARR